MRMSAAPARWLAAGIGLAFLLAACTGTPDPLEPSGPPSGPAPSPLDPLARAELSVVSVQVGQSGASGVVVTADGHILTSDLMVTGAAGDPVTVTFHTEQSGQATVVGDDPRTGLAVIKVDGVPDLTPASFADSDAIQPGDQVRLLGGPLVSGAPVSSGTVVDTSLAVGSSSMLETDAPPTLGTAGGPLVNPAGEVIGITVGSRSAGGGSGEGSFAVPSSLASRVADQLIVGEPVTHPYLGVAAGPADGPGALVQEVVGGSPAAQAGLQAGDVIIRVGDRDVGDPADLLAAVQSGRVGDQLPVGLTRDGSEQEVTVTLAPAPTDR